MIDPKTFIKNVKPKKQMREINGSFSCSEQGCYEVSSIGMYDAEDRKVYWVCPNGHEGSARLIYE